VLAAGAILQAVVQDMLQGAGPVDYYPEVLKGVLLTERFVSGFSFLGPCSWPSFLGVLLLGILLPSVLFLDTRSWALVSGVLFLDPRSWNRRPRTADTCLY
jgi:hypothetical protein